VGFMKAEEEAIDVGTSCCLWRWIPVQGDSDATFSLILDNSLVEIIYLFLHFCTFLIILMLFQNGGLFLFHLFWNIWAGFGVPRMRSTFWSTTIYSTGWALLERNSLGRMGAHRVHNHVLSMDMVGFLKEIPRKYNFFSHHHHSHCGDFL